MERKPRRVRPDVWVRFQKLIVQLLQEEPLPAEDRFRTPDLA